jgi:hypothetical protein
MNNYEFCADYISKLAGGRPTSVLNYGCGLGYIVIALLNRMELKPGPAQDRLTYLAPPAGCGLFHTGPPQ